MAGGARSPRTSRARPATAIIAALSVQTPAREEPRDACRHEAASRARRLAFAPDAPGDDHGVQLRVLHRAQGLADERIHDRILHAAGDIARAAASSRFRAPQDTAVFNPKS